MKVTDMRSIEDFLKAGAIIIAWKLMVALRLRDADMLSWY